MALALTTTESQVIDKYVIKSLTCEFYANNKDATNARIIVNLWKGTGDFPTFKFVKAQQVVLSGEDVTGLMTTIGAMDVLLPLIVAKLQEKNVV